MQVNLKVWIVVMCIILFVGQDTLIMMTREFDPVTEKSLHPEQFGSGKNYTFGSGYKLYIWIRL